MNTPDFFRAIKNNPRLRRLLIFCAPALAVGLVLRVLLTAQMPFGYVQFDSADFLSTPWRLLKDHVLSINEKRTFLVPLLYTIPFLIKIPALLIIPLAQHFLGLATVIMSGALVRLWFARWEWFIVPATVATAIIPGMLWFEHALMAETVYLFCAFGVAIAGTFFAQTKSNAAFKWLLLALFLTTAARPEGKLYFAFAFLLVLLACRGAWKNVAAKFGMLALLFLVVTLLTPTGQSGQLLLATVLPLAPDQSRAFPDASDAIRALSDKARAMHSEIAPDELTTLEKEASNVAHEYFKTHPKVKPKVSAFCQKIAIEAMLNRPSILPVIAFNKFRLTMNTATNIGFNERAVYDKQLRNFTGRDMFYFLSKGLTGMKIASPEEAADFFKTHYRIDGLGWFEDLQQFWKRLTLGAQLPSHQYGGVVVYGLPAFFIVAFLGMLAAIIPSGWRRILHASWLAMFAGLWFAVMITGVVNARYRYVFEPFCVIYVLLFVDSLWNAVAVFKPRDADDNQDPDHRDSLLQRSDHDR